ncbi:MAG TPA: hypothetical protein V6D12_11495 [Candidatus Obscuribacterales bacterium]
MQYEEHSQSDRRSKSRGVLNSVRVDQWCNSLQLRRLSAGVSQGENSRYLKSDYRSTTNVSVFRSKPG